MSNWYKYSNWYNSSTDYYIMTFNAAVNILAVELLVKTEDKSAYSKYANILGNLNESQIESLVTCLSLNRHIKNLGEMITQGDYEDQKETLFEALDGFEKGYDSLMDIWEARD